MTDNTDAGACHLVSNEDDGAVLHSVIIDRVEFTHLPTKYHVRIVVSAQEGKIKIPANAKEKICAGGATEPNITTKPTRYEFTFDGAKIQ